MLKRVLSPIAGSLGWQSDFVKKDWIDPRWLSVQEKLATSKRIIDLGCGTNPVEGATVGVDLYIDPKERSLGQAAKIDAKLIKQKDVAFVKTSIEAPLPFNDKTFDFAYSHHVIEHVENPAVACREMMRIAKSGVIITPSWLAELIFGRSYHRWLVMQREKKIIFFRKRPIEDRPFGEHPEWDAKKKNWIANENTNPFEILLNDCEWYRDGRNCLGFRQF